MSVMTDGLGTKITIAVAGAPTAPVQFYEKGIKPFGLDQGGRIDTTGLRNVQMRTGAPKALTSVTAVTAKVAYDPNIIVNLLNIVGVPGTVTVTYPNGDEVTVDNCWLDKFEPDEVSEGNQPTASVTFETGNSTDGLPDGEALPSFTAFQ